MFESFRKHQKKFLAVLALMAMVAFTLDLGLFRGNGPAYQQNPVVFKMAGREVRAGDLEETRRERLRANQFMANMRDQYGQPMSFGGTSDEEIRQAMVLEREADRLGIPASATLANTWLRQAFPNLTPAKFDQIYRSQFTEGPLSCTDTQLLEDIGKQLRLRFLYSLALDQQRTTPLDLYRGFRDQSERVSAQFVAFPVEKYLAEVANPSDAEISSLYEENKNRLPNPNLDKPGFQIPRRVKVEYVQVDSSDLQRKLRESMTDDELQAYYKGHEKDLPPPPRELPLNLFAGDPEAKLTPRTTELFVEMKDTIRTAASEARAAEEINRKFSLIRDDVMSPFLTDYDQVIAGNAEISEEKAAGKAPTAEPKPIPKPVDGSGQSLVAAAAAKAGLEYQVTPLMTQTDAEKHVPISGASLGTRRFAAGRSFADHLFNSRSGLYEPFELSDARGLRFLAWKSEDLAPQTPELASVRDEVILAWKRIKARDLAKRDADALAQKARDAKGDLRSVAGDLPVTNTSEISKLTMAFDPTGRMPMGAPRASEIPELPNARDELRQAVFGLKLGDVAVESDASKSNFYVLALQHRTPADLALLFSPVGSRSMIQPNIEFEKAREASTDWIKRLEEQAGAGPLVETKRSRSARAVNDFDDGHDHDHDHDHNEP